MKKLRMTEPRMKQRPDRILLKKKPLTTIRQISQRMPAKRINSHRGPANGTFLRTRGGKKEVDCETFAYLIPVSAIYFFFPASTVSPTSLLISPTLVQNLYSFFNIPFVHICIPKQDRRIFLFCFLNPVIRKAIDTDIFFCCFFNQFFFLPPVFK